MIYRYRVEGVAEKAFILRGMHFRVNGTINTDISDTELAFIKERCRLNKIVDITATPQPISANSTKTSKGEKNELPKSTSRANKSANKAKV